MEPLNLYETLGVRRKDSSVAVRRAYRDLARLSHATTGSVPRFVRELELAVAVLSDRARRVHYDDVSRVDPAPIGGDEEAGEHLDLLSDFGGGPPSREEVRDLFRCNFAPGAEPKSCRVHVLDLSIRVHGEPAPTAADALLLAVPRFHACASCHGTGTVEWLACGACDASGLTERRSLVRVPLGEGEQVIWLDELGVRTPILRLHVIARA